MNSPIFVVGTPRSGTTLCAKILGRHSRLFMPGETHFFDDIYSRRTELGEFDQNCKSMICDRLRSLYARFNEPEDQKRIDVLFEQFGDCSALMESWDSHSDVLSAFMESQMRMEGKMRWGNNVPRDIFHTETILSFYPHAKIVVCIRDVRDFLLSYKGKWKTTAPEDVDRLKKLYHPVVTALLWKTSMKRLPSIKAFVPRENLLIVRYEDLVTHPEKTIRALCETIGEKFEEQMLDVDTYGSSHGDKGKGIFSSSVGKWRKELSNEEIWIVQAICKRQLQDLGYDIEKFDVNYFRLISILFSTPLAVIRGLNANRHKRGPLVPYLWKRLRSLVGND